MNQSVKHIKISEYNYNLPDDRIAKYPVAQRDQSKLLVYNHGVISHHVFTELPKFLPANSLLIYNNTKVIQARLHFKKDTGGQIEIFCLEPYSPNDYALIFEQRQSCQWLCLVGNHKKWKQGKLHREISIQGQAITLSAEESGVVGNSFVITFSWDNTSFSFAEVLEAIGELPIPPYLNRETEESDKQTYQTVYSKIDGSVAAPTAGLHFTERVLSDIDKRGIQRDEVTLHVGAGTFKPVKSEKIEGHEMHSEYICVNKSTIQNLINHGGHCVAVGTTSVRTLESLYFIGLKILANPSISEDDLTIPQWMPYELSEEQLSVSSLQSLQTVHDYMERNQLKTIHTNTCIIIAPGYTYKVVSMIITNFHMPQSTLLLLVSALIGNDWHKVYDYALSHDFRFLSYGDSSLLIP